MNKLVSAILLGLLVTSAVYGQRDNPFYISADSLNKYTSFGSNYDWLFHPGLDSSFADPEIQDSSWLKVNSRLYPNDGIPADWDGGGWFRLWVYVDSSLTGNTIGLRFMSMSEMDIYLNGNLIQRIGEPAHGSEKTDLKIHKGIHTITFHRSGLNLLAVRYANPEIEYFHKYNYSAGFYLSFGFFEKLVERDINNTRLLTILEVLFIAVPLSLAFIHFFLFLFDRRSKDNFFYALFLLIFALFITINFHRNFLENPYRAILFYRLSLFGLVGSITAVCVAIYSMFGRIGTFIKLMTITALLLSIAGFIYPFKTTFYVSYAYIMLVSAPTGYTIWQERKNGLGGEWIIRTGFIFMSVMGFSNMLQSLGIIPEVFGMRALYIWGVLGFIFFMSVSLARDFFITNKRLEKQLEAVKELSDKTLKQELAAKELETKKQLLEADNERKTMELESARTLQLSMLPQTLPEVDGLEIGARMQTATEVGGDYFDFALAKDGTLNIAIGDATGHGTKAGIMVATVKSLFAALGSNMMIRDFFSRCTEILKNMNLGNLFMSMTLLRIKENYVIASSAGMPPIILYKRELDIVDEYVIKGMPLGAFVGFDYEEIELELSSGDVVLLMSDGLTELFNENKEMFGDKRIMDLLRNNSNKTPDDLINVFVEAAEKWRGYSPQNDDITFVVIKIK